MRKEAGDPEGPFILAATSEEKVSGEDAAPKSSHVFLIDCSSFYSDALLDNESLGNKNLIPQALSYVSDSSDILDIPEKSLSNTRIAVSWSAILTIGIIFIGVLPVLLILTGFAVFVRRRRS